MTATYTERQDKADKRVVLLEGQVTSREAALERAHKATEAAKAASDLFADEARMGNLKQEMI